MTDWSEYQDDISDAISDSMDMDWSANDGARAVVRWLNENKPLSAAPAPEGGAVWFGVTGAADETEALAVALFDARCPGIRMTEEDMHYYRAAAQRAMQAVEDELDTPALATREEAPAEAGERDYPAEFEAWWATYRHRNRDVADYSVKKQIAFDAFYHAALRASSSAPEALGNLLAVIHGDGGHRALEVGTKQAALEAEKIVAGLLAAHAQEAPADGAGESLMLVGNPFGTGLSEPRLVRARSSAPPAREEAPAEVGDFGDALLAFLYRHGLKVALDVSEIEALRQSALRAQPPAREDAQPDAGARLAKAMWGVDLVPAANPAPDALRAALVSITLAVQLGEAHDTALAALQAEQGVK